MLWEPSAYKKLVVCYNRRYTLPAHFLSTLCLHWHVFLSVMPGSQAAELVQAHIRIAVAFFPFRHLLTIDTQTIPSLAAVSVKNEQTTCTFLFHESLSENPPNLRKSIGIPDWSKRIKNLQPPTAAKPTSNIYAESTHAEEETLFQDLSRLRSFCEYAYVPRNRTAPSHKVRLK